LYLENIFCLSLFDNLHAVIKH